jgi:hypothetical protein
MNRQEMEKAWDRRGCEFYDAYTCWDQNGYAIRGHQCPPFSPGEKALAFRRKVLGGWGWPKWPKTVSRNFTPPEIFVERIKEDCPNNAKEILANYGKLDKWDCQPTSHWASWARREVSRHLTEIA